MESQIIPSIQILQQTEQQVIKLLEIASNTCLELSKSDPNHQFLSIQSEEYVSLIKSIKQSISTQILKMGMEVPYLNSSYGSRKDAEISFMKIDHILNQLNSMRNALGPLQPPLNTTPVFSPSNSPMIINPMQTSPTSDSNQILPEGIFDDGMAMESENTFQVDPSDNHEEIEGMSEEFEDVELNI